MNAEAEPKLDAPGAGLPAAELMIARTLFWWRVRKGSREKFIAFFQAEREQVRRLVAQCGPERAGKRVLIDRARGLEDSSRYWSVWMTLEHLRIVQESIARIILELANGRQPGGKVSTAAVKPSPAVTGEVVDGYEKSCETVIAAGLAAPNLKTNLRHEHPWFGPLDAYEWLALSAGHLQIHRKQIERILEGLRNEKGVTANAGDSIPAEPVH